MSAPLSIMIVEDQQDIAHLYSLYLARLGIDSTSFDNPLEALNHYQQNHGRYALVLLDWTLPMINGLELAKRIRKIDSNVRIFLITGYLVKEMVHDDEFREAKISEVLQKPIRFEDLRPRIIKLSG
jgi:DNA-binding response OmpR family regulator